MNEYFDPTDQFDDQQAAQDIADANAFYKDLWTAMDTFGKKLLVLFPNQPRDDESVYWCCDRTGNWLYCVYTHCSRSYFARAKELAEEFLIKDLKSMWFENNPTPEQSEALDKAAAVLHELLSDL